MNKKIQVGYGSHTRGSTKKGLYGKQRSGKLKENGGFSGQPTVGYVNIPEERWEQIDWNK